MQCKLKFAFIVRIYRGFGSVSCVIKQLLSLDVKMFALHCV